MPSGNRLGGRKILSHAQCQDLKNAQSADQFSADKNVGPGLLRKREDLPYLLMKLPRGYFNSFLFMTRLTRSTEVKRNMFVPVDRFQHLSPPFLGI